MALRGDPTRSRGPRVSLSFRQTDGAPADEREDGGVSEPFPVGCPTSRWEAMAKTCGRERYASEVVEDGMVWAVARRADVPSALPEGARNVAGRLGFGSPGRPDGLGREGDQSPGHPWSRGRPSSTRDGRGTWPPRASSAGETSSPFWPRAITSSRRPSASPPRNMPTWRRKAAWLAMADRS